MRIERSFGEPLHTVTLSRGAIEEHYLCAHAPCAHAPSAHAPGAHASSSDPLAVFRGFPPERAEVLAQWVFGGCKFHGEALSAMDGAHWPLTWVHGDGCSGENLTGAQAFAVSGTNVTNIELDNHIVGRTYADEDAACCLLGGLLPADISRTRSDQASSTFERLEAALKQVAMDFSHVVRTWIYLEDILDWYDAFNQARTSFFEERGVFDRLIPASTGIGAANPSGAALVMGAVAIKPKNESVSAFAVPSPLQCPATSYRSSFSRAVEVHLPGRRHLYISGTASIAPNGETIHQGDVDKQIERTMAVCEAILESRDMSWSDATRVVAYFKDVQDVPRFDDYCRSRKLPQLPVALSHAAVCRDDLLFEVEADALRLS